LGYKGICCNLKVIDELNILPQDMTKEVDWSSQGHAPGSRAGLCVKGDKY